jgi:hypothetical protein
MKKLILVAAVALSAVAMSSRAAEFEVTYALTPTENFDIVLGGSLSSDGLVFEVSGVDSFDVNGTSLPGFTVVSSDYYLPQDTYGPSVAIDGSVIDLFFDDFNPVTQTGGRLFGFAVGDAQAASEGFDGVGGSGFPGTDNFYHPIVRADYSGRLLSASGAPEPASWAMLIAGFGLVGATMRRVKTKPGFA